MSLHAVKIQEINITNSSKKEILEELEKFLIEGSWLAQKSTKNSKKIVSIVTPNPEQIIYARNHSQFAEMLNRADVALPDGIGLVWASRVLAKNPISNFQFPIKEAIPGIDFMEELVALSVNRHVPIALIGGRSGIAVEAFECLRQKHPDILGVAMDAPHFTIGTLGLAMDGSIDDYFKNLAQQLKRQRIGIVFVALGAPKQEYFMEQLSMSLRGTSQRETRQSTQIASPSEQTRKDNRIVLMSVGGSLDEISGNIPRAPAWVSRVGLKWLWRLGLEPWRWKRQISLLNFILLVLTHRRRMNTSS